MANERKGGSRAARHAAVALALAVSPPALADAVALVGDDGPSGVVYLTDAAHASLDGPQEDEREDAGSLDYPRAGALGVRPWDGPAGSRAHPRDSSDEPQGWPDHPDRPAKPAGTLPEVRRFQDHVTMAGRTYGLDPDLLHAVISVESNYDVNAVSPKGAIGLMQLMPGTGRRYGVSAKELRQPQDNIRCGSRYLAELLQRFGYDLVLALAGYNAGEYAVIRYGMRVPPYAETQTYVLRVLRAYERLRASVNEPRAGFGRALNH